MIILLKALIPLACGRSEFMLYLEVLEVHKQVSFIEIYIKLCIIGSIIDCGVA